MRKEALLDRTFLPACILLLLSFCLFEVTNLDLWVQDHFYNWATHSWIVNHRAPIPRFWFYNLPKALIIAMGVIMMLYMIWSGIREKSARFVWVNQKGILVVVATIILAPLLISTLKATTNVFTPEQIRRYGGFVPYVRVCEHYPKHDTPKKRGRGFPAGHASGGYALMSLAGLAGTRRKQLWGLVTGLSVGTVMGVYQMLKGAHYVSHTIITIWICWIVFLLLRKAFRVPEALDSVSRRADALPAP